MLEKKINPEIFRAYDIRGVYGKDIDAGVFQKIGNAFRVFSGKKLVVGRDNRLSSQELKDGFVKGMTMAGVDVIDIGMVPRGIAMFAAWKKSLNSAYVTASHLPPEWNGIKFVRKDGTSFAGDENARLRDMVINGDVLDSSWGSIKEERVIDDFEKHVLSKVPKPAKGLKILLDCGNGTAGIAAPEVFKRAGHDVETLFSEPDGSFPNRKSELKSEALKKAQEKSKGFDVTVAYDGDADRIALIDNDGRIVEPETVAYLIMLKLLKEQKGNVVANVESSRTIDDVASRFGRKVFRTPVGYPFVIKAVYKHKACFGVERSMHFSIPYIFPFDDGIAASLYAAYSLSASGKSLAEIVDSIPATFKDQINIECPDEKKPLVIENIRQKLSQEYDNINSMDGLRVDTEKGWFLIRQSNTEPLIRLTIEAENENVMKEFRDRFSEMINEEKKAL